MKIATTDKGRRKGEKKIERVNERRILRKSTDKEDGKEICERKTNSRRKSKERKE